MSYHDILVKVGDFGLYQKLLCGIFVFYTTFLCGLNFYTQVTVCQIISTNSSSISSSQTWPWSRCSSSTRRPTGAPTTWSPGSRDEAEPLGKKSSPGCQESPATPAPATWSMPAALSRSSGTSRPLISRHSTSRTPIQTSLQLSGEDFSQSEMFLTTYNQAQCDKFGGG